jgi:hypothetical protein
MLKWKSLIDEYVRRANQSEAEYHFFMDDLLLGDERFLRLEQQRLERLKLRDLETGRKPVHEETRYKIMSVEETERKLTVEFMLTKKSVRRRQGVEQTEERMDQVRVTLASLPSGTWVIVGVDPAVPERRTMRELGVGRRIEDEPFRQPRLTRPAQPEPIEIQTQTPFYQREAVKRYADQYWNEPNPRYLHFAVDCTNYVSQCLYAGGAPMHYTDVRETGWWYKGQSGGKELWSYSWSVAHSLQLFLLTIRRSGLRAEEVRSPEELTTGDVICYDFDGNGRFQHSAIVTATDGAGFPLVNAHTTNCKGRYWDYQDSYAWTERTVYRFFRIRDRF